MTAPLKEPFFRNDILLDSSQVPHRLLHIDASDADSHAWLISLEAEKPTPYRVSLAALEHSFTRVSALDKVPAVLPPPPSAASLALSDRAFSRIAPLVDNPDILDPSKRNALLVARSKEPDTGAPNTLMADLRRWWCKGQTRDALLGSYENCGRISDGGSGGRGRRNKRNQVAYQLTTEDLAKMRGVVERYYLERNRFRTLADTLRELHASEYSYIDGNGTKCLLPSSECPSLRQLQHFIKRNYPLLERETRRKGEKRVALEDRATTGSIQLECHGAGHIYEFDATIVDVVLVSSSDRATLVGKPTLYLIIDRHSRLIVGSYVGFENASFSPAMQAILNIGEDKAAMCSRLGIPYDAADWPAQGVLPEQFLADQGELMHKKARHIARSLRSTISNVPGLRPDWKPLVECGFMMLHQVIAPDTPAYAPDAETKQRRSTNRDRQAALTLEEFTRVITLAIISHNKTMQTGYPLTLAQAADGVRPIPRELWAHSIQRRMGVLDRMDYDKVRAELIPRDKATVTADGIVYKKMHYSCPEAEALGWMVDGRRARRQLDIAFDYRLVDEIIVYAPDNTGKSFVAGLCKDSGKFVGMSFADVERHWRAVDKLTEGAADIKREARFQYREATRPINANAEALAAVAKKGKSHSGRRKDMAPARADELAKERQTTAGVRPRESGSELTALATQTAASVSVSLPTPLPTSVLPAPSVAPPVAPPVASTNVIALNRHQPGAAENVTANATASPDNPASSLPSDRKLSLKERMALARQSMIA